MVVAALLVASSENERAEVDSHIVHAHSLERTRSLDTAYTRGAGKLRQEIVNQQVAQWQKQIRHDQAIEEDAGAHTPSSGLVVQLKSKDE